MQASQVGGQGWAGDVRGDGAPPRSLLRLVCDRLGARLVRMGPYKGNKKLQAAVSSQAAAREIVMSCPAR